MLWAKVASAMEGLKLELLVKGRLALNVLPHTASNIKKLSRYQLKLELLVKPSNAETYFHPKHKDAKISENNLNPLMWVFIG